MEGLLIKNRNILSVGDIVKTGTFKNFQNILILKTK